MTTKTTKAKAKGTAAATPLPPPTAAPTAHPVAIPARTRAIVDDVVAWLQGLADDDNRAGMARYGIPVAHAVGVSMEPLKAKARALGRDHELAQALWQAGLLETRLLAAFVDVPAQVTPAQMTAWLDDVDGWSLCDTLCIHLFGKCPHAWPMARRLVASEALWSKRAGFALVATLAVHGDDEDALLEALSWIADAAVDERHFVKKAVNWALRQIGKRNARLHAAAVPVAEALASSTSAAARLVGGDALRELRSTAVLTRLASRAAAKKTPTVKKKKKKLVTKAKAQT